MDIRNFYIVALILLNIHWLKGQNFYELSLDTKVYKTDTILADDKVEIVYTNYLKKSEFRVFFKNVNDLIPDGACSYIDSSGSTITGQYKNGDMTGYWIETNKEGNRTRTVNYGFKIKFIPEDSLRYKGEYRVDIPPREIYLVERMPEFQGESPIQSFNRYIKKNIFVPPSYRFFENEKRRVFVGFVVNGHGKVINIRVLKGDGNDLNREALRVISTSPGWSPGLAEERPTDVDFTFPVSFLNGENK